MLLYFNNSATTREKKKPPMRFQARDGQILQTIYEFDGVLAKRHLKELFWIKKSQRAMEKRIYKLHHAEYLQEPTREQWRSEPIQEPICWLGQKGILWVAGKKGVSIRSPDKLNESKLRQLENNLRAHGITWVREPRWMQLRHDLAVADFRIAIQKALQIFPSLELEDWLPEGTFRRLSRKNAYLRNQGSSSIKRKGIHPDSYFSVVGDNNRQGFMRARFLLEIDLATHDNPSFGREKVLPGIDFLLSQSYKHLSGDNSGRWLVVTTGERRLSNLKRQTEQVAGTQASAFFFTTFEMIMPETILTHPIWFRGGDKRPSALFS